MIQNVLRAIGGIGVYDTISICLFITIFTAALIRTVLLKKSYLDEVSALPLQEDDAPAALESSNSGTMCSLVNFVAQGPSARILQSEAGENGLRNATSQRSEAPPR